MEIELLNSPTNILLLLQLIKPKNMHNILTKKYVIT